MVCRMHAVVAAAEDPAGPAVELVRPAARGPRPAPTWRGSLTGTRLTLYVEVGVFALRLSSMRAAKASRVRRNPKA